MGTISAAFSIASGALQADQGALDVVANNVANAHTAGYSREVPGIHENDSVQIGPIRYGMGVTTKGGTSERDTILNQRLNQQQQLASEAGSRMEALDSVQAVFSVASGISETGNIGNDLSRFFNSFTALQAEPTSISERENVLSSASTLASEISGAANSLSKQQAAVDQEAAGITTQINALTASISQLNGEILKSSPNSDAGTLEDQRQADIASLAKLVGINQITTEHNGMAITTTSGTLLVSGDSSYELTNGNVDGATHFFNGTKDITADLTGEGGQLGGFLTARDKDIPEVMHSLDALAYSISTNINTLNNAGEKLDGTSGSSTNPNYMFYQPKDSDGAASTMHVIMTDPSMIAAASANAGIGDNSNAVAMAELANTPIVHGVDAAGAVTNTAPATFYSALISVLGSKVSQAHTESTVLNTSVSQLKTQVDSLSAVNLDDEASELTTFQRSYQAASQVFSILNNIMNSALNLGQSTAVS